MDVGPHTGQNFEREKQSATFVVKNLKTDSDEY